MTQVFISILNWNAAAATLECLRTVFSSAAAMVNTTVVVLDNGSRNEDWSELHAGCSGSSVRIVRREKNTGFAGGHNTVIRMALEQKADFIWLLNNDALVEPDTLYRLLSHMQDNPRLGAVSPVIYARHDPSVVDFCGAIHNWQALDSICARSLEAGQRMQQNHPREFFLFGTAPLLRIAAIRQTGVLEDRLFAYYEDDDLCIRLSNLGWESRVAFDVSILHVRHRSYADDRPAYYFYLMARNSIIFYAKHTPYSQRRLLRLRLFARAMIKAALMEERGYKEKANAILTGTLHGLKNIGGPPQPNVPAPAWLKLVAKIFPYRLQQWLG